MYRYYKPHGVYFQKALMLSVTPLDVHNMMGKSRLIEFFFYFERQQAVITIPSEMSWCLFN